MASVWLHERGKKEPEKLMGRLREQDAIRYLQHALSIYKGFRQQVFDYEFLLFDSKADYKASKPAASMYIEFCSPPSAPERGQPHVAHERKAQ